MSHRQWIMKSPLGPLHLIASDRGLSGLYFDRQKVPLASSLRRQPHLTKAVRQLNEYFAGQRRDFNLVLDMVGTVFQLQVWQALAKIPFGETQSYGEVALRIKKAKAVRAVGSANGKNPLCIIVPCHRVIGSDGSLTGFAGGLHRKKWLLEFETPPIQGELF